MTAGKTQGGSQPQNIELRVSQQSQAELKKFLDLMKSVEKTTKDVRLSLGTVTGTLINSSDVLQDMKRDMKLLKTFTDGLKRNAIFTTGAGSYLQGKQFQEERSAGRTARLGTDIGQQIALQREGLALAKEGLRYDTQRNLKQRVFNLDLEASTQTFRKITSIKKAQALAEAASIRRGGEIQQGNVEQARQAERIQRLAEARVRMLQKEQQQTKALAKEEERRADRLRKLRTPDRQMERAEAAAARRKSMDRLFSDGGAGLFGVQAGIMANYMVMNQARNATVGGVQFSADLDEELRNLQAITVVTDQNLNDLKEEILDVSEATKFFATDIASASVTLGQAGFSTKEIKDSIRAVALLATATGTDLARSVDLTTSILGVFNMESAQMVNVADTLTAAVNNSKLNIDKLALGLQYAGNTAAQSGVSFEELTASLGAMANAGIRSGSTLGTGMRQILIALQKPSGKFKDTLDRLGLTMSDVDLRTQGLYGVMQNLADGGFTAGDAIRSFEVRAAAAFNALAGNLDEVVKLERAFLNSAAAMEANETQMRALSNQGRRFSANLQAVVSTGLEPLVYTFRDLLKWMADGLQTWRDYPVVIRSITVSLASLAAGLIAARTAWLGINLVAMVTGLKSLITTIRAAQAGTLAFSAVVAPATVVIGGLVAAAYLGITAFSRYDRELDKAKTGVQEAQTAFDDAGGAMEEVASQVEMVSDRIKQLSDRSKLLNENDNLLQLETDKVREQFHEMGLELTDSVKDVDDLIEALKRLRGELEKDYVIKVRDSAVAIDRLMSANTDEIAARRANVDSRAAPLMRDAWTGLGRGEFFNVLDKVLSEDTNVNQLSGSLNALNDFADAFRKEGLSTRDRRFLDVVMTDVKEIVRLTMRNTSLAHEKRDIETNALNAQNRLDNPQLVSQVDAFKLQRDRRIHDAANGVGSEAVPRFEAGREELAAMKAEGKGIIDQLDQALNAGLLNETVYNELKRDIQNTVAAAELAVAGLGDTAKDAAEDAAEVEQTLQKTKQARLSYAQSKSEDPTEINDLGDQRLLTLYAQKAADIDALLAEYDQDSSNELYKAKLAELERQYAQEADTANRETQAHLARVKDIEIQKLETRRQQLEQALELAVAGEDREGIRDELATVAMEMDQLRKDREALVIEGAEALAAAQAKISANTDATLQALSEGNEEDAVAAAERDVEIAERALEAVKDLARTAMDNKKLAEAQLKKAAALAAFAEAVNARAEVKTQTGDGTAEQNAEDAQNAIDEANRETQAIFDRAGRRITRSSGGSAYSKKRDYIDKLIDELEAKLDVAENYLAAGQDVSTEYSDVMDTALAKVSEIHGQIDTLQAKLQAGGLTTSEQEKLNGLIDQQARMTTFIREEEMRIALIKMQQGDYLGGIVLTTSAWVRENLNLEKTLQDGIMGALSNAKSALADFFTAWSNGSKTGKEAFKDLAVSVIKSIQRILAEMMAVYILQKALGWVAGAIGGDTGAKLQAIADGLREGGEVKNAAHGEYVKGNLNRDSKRYNLMPGEYVLRKSAVQAIGVDELDRLNAMGNTTMQASAGINGAANNAPKSKDSGRNINFYLVDERSQAGSLGPHDVLAVVNDDIARGGTTKKLIKSVQMGNM